MRIFTKRIHLAGIGGAGMSPLAEYLHSQGHKITGSDNKCSDVTRYLEKIGIPIQYTHEPQYIKNADILIYSSAIRKNNPERVYAENNGVVPIRRAEALGLIMRGRYTVCIAGTHGKTTTTSMVGEVFCAANTDPTIIVGGKMRNNHSNATIGHGNILIAEADEYDRSFLAMYPSVAIITNIEADHLDCYGTIEAIKEAFVGFCDRVPFDGAVIACKDDAGVRDILPLVHKTIITYAVNCDADYMAEDITFENGKTLYTIKKHGDVLGKICLSVPGMHNVKNSLAAFAAASEMGIDFETISHALSSFKGVSRRFEIVDEINGISIIDDYAHHPGEINATIDAAKGCNYKRIIVIFQPHLYSRTRDFADGFAQSLSKADMVFLPDIYKAREEVQPGVSSENIVCKIHDNGNKNAWYQPDKTELINKISCIAEAGDAVIFMGAGDVGEMAGILAERLTNG
ncbi:MAG: UDP-N-acetylmuramate--L-alanine ligase [Fibrobacter sp.]|nr:UDP-N-acetylmuramate--L-alanine ligase [Fibrobacter sp.]